MSLAGSRAPVTQTQRYILVCLVGRWGGIQTQDDEGGARVGAGVGGFSFEQPGGS